MPIDPVFYRRAAGRYLTPAELEASMRAARRMRAEAVHLLWRALRGRIAGRFRRRAAAKLQTC